MTYQQPPDGQPWPQQGQPFSQYPPQQPYGQQPYQPPTPPGRGRKSWPRRHKFLAAFLGFAGFWVIVIVAIAAASGSSAPAVPAAAATSAAPAVQATHASAAPRPKPAAARTVATFTGSGIQNTPRFTVTATWKLVYSFNCAAFGSAGNFVIEEDGGSDFNGVSVNDLAMSKSASTWGYDDAGTHFLAVNSECSWKVKVVDEP